METNGATTAENRIRTEVSKSGLTVSRVYEGMYQKEGTLTAELRQEIKTDSFYPSKSVANNMQDNIFGTSDFGFTEQEYSNTEKRVAWIDVPMGSTVESVTAKLANFPNAHLYRVLANEPILTDSQAYAIAPTNGDEPLTTKEAIANGQVVRIPADVEGDGGKLALDRNGNPQYRAIFFSADGKKVDEDRRTTAKEPYMTPEIAQEFNGGHFVERGQSL